MMEEYQALFRFLDQLGETLEKLTEIQRKKTAAVQKDDLMGVNECMKQEQALSLSLRGMDAKREKLLAAAGLQGTALSQLPERCPSEFRLPAREVADRLRTRYQIYRSASQVARTTLEVNLHQIETFLQAEGGQEVRSLTDIRA